MDLRGVAVSYERGSPEAFVSLATGCGATRQTGDLYPAVPGFPVLFQAVPGTKMNYFTEMCSGSEAGSYLRRIDFVNHSSLALRVIKKKDSP